MNYSHDLNFFYNKKNHKQALIKLASKFLLITQKFNLFFKNFKMFV